MAEENEVEQKALSMGWLPKDKFRGNAEHWVEAEKYVERGEQFIPFIQADRRKLTEELTRDRQKISELENNLREATETMEALKEFRTELNKERVEEQRDNLVAGIKDAREKGDVDTEVRLQDKLAETREALKEPEKPAPKAAAVTPAQDVTKTPEWAGFVQDNPWWNTDAAMRAASVAIGQDLAATGKLDGLSQQQRFAAIAKATKERFGMEEQPRTSRVEGSRGGASGQREQGGGKTFNDLPAEAKQAAERFEERLVGKKPGQFKDVDAYHKNFADEYFRKNPNG